MVQAFTNNFSMSKTNQSPIVYKVVGLNRFNMGTLFKRSAGARQLLVKGAYYPSKHMYACHVYGNERKVYFFRVDLPCFIRIK